jgi:hypothetical protein
LFGRGFLQLLTLLAEFFGFGSELVALLFELRLKLLFQIMFNLVIKHIADVKFMAAFRAFNGGGCFGHYSSRSG